MNDTELCEKMSEMYRAGASAADIYAFAMQNDASDLVIGLVTQCYCVTENTNGMYKIPWVTDLIDQHGKPKEFVRQLLLQHCSSNEEIPPGATCFRIALLQDSTSWIAFENENQFEDCMRRIAITEPAYFLEERQKLEFQFGSYHYPEEAAYFRSNGASNEREQQIYNKIQERGSDRTRKLLILAAQNVGWLSNDSQLDVLLTLPAHKLERAAAQHFPDARGCVLLGFVLAKSVSNTEAVWRFTTKWRRAVSEKPQKAPLYFRWMLEGARRAGDLFMFEMICKPMLLSHIERVAGWTTGQVEHKTDREQMECSRRDGSLRLVFTNEQNSEWCDSIQIQEGTIVFIPTRPSNLPTDEELEKDNKPYPHLDRRYETLLRRFDKIVDQPQLKVYRTALQPLQPPTPKMLAIAKERKKI